MAPAVAALVIAPIGSSTTALAAGDDPSYSTPAYHDHDHDHGDDDDDDWEGGSLVELLDEVADLLRGVAHLVGGDD
jgi:hypothetical protein